MNSSFCGKVNHDMQKIKYLCIDAQCKWVEKLGCADCFLDDHALHQRVHTEEFINQASSKILELKTNHCDSVFKTIQELQETIDKQFENCAGAILERFENVRKQIKVNIESEAQNLQQKQDEINKSVNQQAELITALFEKPLENLDDEEIAQMTKIYYELPSIQTWHSTQIEQLKWERDQIKQKKQKHLRKLNQVVNKLLKEFGDNKTPEKDESVQEISLNATPEKKQTNQQIFQNSQTKSPPRIILEIERQGRKSIINQSNKKISARKKQVYIE